MALLVTDSTIFNLNVSKQRGVPDIVLFSAFETGLVESRVRTSSSAVGFSWCE